MKKLYIKIDIEDWCRLCDKLSIYPESDINHVLEKLDILQKLLINLQRKLYKRRKKP